MEEGWGRVRIEGGKMWRDTGQVAVHLRFTVFEGQFTVFDGVCLLRYSSGTDELRRATDLKGEPSPREKQPWIIQTETKRYSEHTCVLCVCMCNEKSVSACERRHCEIRVTLTQRVKVNRS